MVHACMSGSIPPQIFHSRLFNPARQASVVNSKFYFQSKTFLLQYDRRSNNDAFICKYKKFPFLVKANANLLSNGGTSESSKPISLGTAELPLDIDLKKLENLLYQWASSITQNANLPLPAPLQVDKIDYGVRLSYVNVVDGKTEVLVDIDVTVKPAEADESCPMFRATRDGPLKNSVPSGEPAIMQSLLAALRKSVSLCRN